MVKGIKHNNNIRVLLLACLLVLLTACGVEKDAGKDIAGSQGTLTMDTLIELSRKGEELTWSDFEDYEYVDIGSGLIIRRYETDKAYYVLVGGGSLETTPFYIRLVSLEDDNNNIDIRKERIEDFLTLNNQ